MLHAIFGPAMEIMSRLRFALKLGLIGALFMVPLVALVLLLYGNITTDIAFVQTERLGVQQIIPARFLVQSIQEHRGMSQIVLGGDAEAKEKLAVIASKIDRRLKTLSEISEKAGAVLGTSEAFSKLEKQWLELKANNIQYSAQESFERHNKLVDSILDYITFISDKSNLTLDPDMDSYYVMDATVFRIPVVIDYVGRLRALGSGMLKRQAITPDQKIELFVLHRLYTKDFDALQSDFAKASGANDKLAAALEAKGNEVRSASEHFLQKEVAALMNGDLTLAPAEYFNRATAAIDTLYGLFDASTEQLDGLLSARIHRQQTNLTMIFGGVALVLVLVLYLFAGMLLSVMRSLRSIEAGAERLARGDVSKLVDSHSRDELRKVGGAVNSVVHTLDKFIKAQLEMALAHNQEGRTSHEMRPSEFAGAYGEMARNVNEMVKGHIGVQTRFVDLMVEYANGAFESRMETLPGERKKISDTAEKVRAELESAAQAARYNARVKAALDYVSIPVRIANDEGDILYVNNAMTETLHKYEGAFRRQIPDFNPGEIVGKNICMFYADPHSAIAQLRGIVRATASRMSFGGRDYDVVTSPVFSEKGEPRHGRAMDRHHRATCRRKGNRKPCRKRRCGRLQETHLGSRQDRLPAANEPRPQHDFEHEQKALGEIARILKALSQGDLTQKIETEFQGVFAGLKDDSNATIEQLRDIIAKIREASESINTAAREIAMGNNDLSRRTEEEASSLEETASSIEELAATVKQNAGNALSANTLAAEASKSATRGGEVVAKVIQTMDGITESNRAIADITTLIDGIAFQTNLLALNAAVEAARAGEQGRGFAVVASEVRSLAQRAAEAARSIKALIANSVGKVEEGGRLVKNAGQAMEEIVAQVQRVTAIMGEIAAASEEQSDGIQQVNKAVTQIDQLTQQNAALVEEATAAARSLEEQSEGLVRSVAIFKLTADRSGDGKGETSRARSERNGQLNGRAGLQLDKTGWH